MRWFGGEWLHHRSRAIQAEKPVSAEVLATKSELGNAFSREVAHRILLSLDAFLLWIQRFRNRSQMFVTAIAAKPVAYGSTGIKYLTEVTI